ncbi:MAG: hypothetical protein G01um10143_466 [Parcubacteria group bacterium Gr01-1014_3]|nr:MAG: hypothetical protein G01um10143_466 [Parcubacteria group bacterium Gr01-1014_3]
MKKLMFGALEVLLCGGRDAGDKDNRSRPVTMTFRKPKDREYPPYIEEKLGKRVLITLSELEGWTTLVTDFKSVEDVKSLLDEDESTRQVA